MHRELENIGGCNAFISHYHLKDEMDLVGPFEWTFRVTKTYPVTAAYQKCEEGFPTAGSLQQNPSVSRGGN
jgi:hypothetical protein